MAEENVSTISGMSLAEENDVSATIKNNLFSKKVVD